MWQRLARITQRPATWAVLLAILAIGLQVIGWDRLGRAALILVGGIAEATWPALRLVWPGLVVLAIAGLLSRRGRALLGRMRMGIRVPWLVSGLALAVLGLVVLSLLVFPGYLVQRSLDATGTPAIGPAERLKAENDARTTLLQGVAGLVLVVGAGATWRQLQINREGQITERFSKAIDHLGDRGDDRIDVRLGGIYALERIANNSKDDRATIAEILTAYVRGHAAWTTPVDEAVPSKASMVKLGELRVRAPDIQAVMTVLGRRALPPGKTQRLKTQRLLLAYTDLRRADLVDAHLEQASLLGAHLEWVHLDRAHLKGADLFDAHLEGAHLAGAHLEGAILADAHLEGAHLIGAHLEEAHLDRAHLKGADLKGAILVDAHLEGAILADAHLEEAVLVRAHLERADLADALLQGADLAEAHLEGADLTGAHLGRANLAYAHLGGANLADAHLKGAYLGGALLVGAIATPGTSWPNYFDWKGAKIRMMD